MYSSLHLSIPHSQSVPLSFPLPLNNHKTALHVSKSTLDQYTHSCVSFLDHTHTSDIIQPESLSVWPTSPSKYPPGPYMPLQTAISHSFPWPSNYTPTPHPPQQIVCWWAPGLCPCLGHCKQCHRAHAFPWSRVLAPSGYRPRSGTAGHIAASPSVF